MDLGLTGRVAFVGGSSQGLGRAIAEELAAEGATVAICGRNEETLAESRAAIEEATGARVLGVAGDLSVRADAERVIDDAARDLGKIDILVTNTGGPRAGRFEELSPDDWDHAFHLLLESAVTLARAVLPGMKDDGWGRIICVTSVAVKQPVDNLMLSNSVRSSVTGFARTLANEVGSHGVTVNCVLPGYTRTERLVELAERLMADSDTASSIEEVFGTWERETPAGRLGEPRELAALVAFLASERAAYINGTSIPVDGGWTRSLL